MDLDDKNATGVSKELTSTEPAKNAETVKADELAGGAPIAAAASSYETYVSPELESKILSIVTNAVREYLFANPPTIGLAQLEQITDSAQKAAADVVAEGQQALELQVSKEIDAAKADIIAHLTPLVSAIVSGKAKPERVLDANPAAAADAHAIVAGDPVKIWADPEHSKFRLGSVVAVHDAGHAFDVELDDGTITKVVAEGLAFDDRR